MISIIIPVYNVEDYLHVCLTSVLNQTYQNFEVICIDDASTDSSLEILEYFAQKDSRIKILKNKSNRGSGYSIKECIYNQKTDGKRKRGMLKYLDTSSKVLASG